MRWLLQLLCGDKDEYIDVGSRRAEFLRTNGREHEEVHENRPVVRKFVPQANLELWPKRRNS